ncbi:hypothetical protein LQZ21_00150 [Treponema sp. TIM-1]|uniref:hypothetical protein n=1 Tax=Treponema sp. TIM-1 TaxID=2898417 RepID=UPI00398038E9
MAIQPIDLQTLFTQVDKVGKSQAAQKEGLQIQQALQGDQIQRKTDERIQSVNESQDTGEGAETIRDRASRKNGGEEKQGREGKDEDSEDERPGEPLVFRDPDLGRNIDVSG